MNLPPGERTEDKGGSFAMRKEGLEPSRPCGHKLLRLTRLPVPPLPHLRKHIYYTHHPTKGKALLLGASSFVNDDANDEPSTVAGQSTTLPFQCLDFSGLFF